MFKPTIEIKQSKEIHPNKILGLVTNVDTRNWTIKQKDINPEHTGDILISYLDKEYKLNKNSYNICDAEIIYIKDSYKINKNTIKTIWSKILNFNILHNDNYLINYSICKKGQTIVGYIKDDMFNFLNIIEI